MVFGRPSLADAPPFLGISSGGPTGWKVPALTRLHSSIAYATGLRRGHPDPGLCAMASRMSWWCAVATLTLRV